RPMPLAAPVTIALMAGGTGPKSRSRSTSRFSRLRHLGSIPDCLLLWSYIKLDDAQRKSPAKGRPVTERQ
ncbi:MAG: hypothetical protein ACRYG8_54870, partial [Janthinobacterium lividum]